MNQIIKSEIEEISRDIESSGRFAMTKEFSQHGGTSVFEHCENAAYMSTAIANKFGMSINQRRLIRGALLHDYFLYDWHEKNDRKGLHGFSHPKCALENAEEDFNLSDVERNIIVRHMFPLTIVPPKYKEAWLVCLADKICAVKEMVQNKCS